MLCLSINKKRVFMKSKNDFMSYRTPANMHSDGVYFYIELLARKKGANTVDYFLMVPEK